jgi:catechol 2,3-dioxygenase-like lactoylglutathione lyase family enzyme
MPVSGPDHLLVLTSDMDATRDFWCRALGLEVGERPPLEFPGYWLYADGVACVHIADRATYESHSEQIGIPASATAVDHVAFSGDGYRQVVERLAESGVEAAENEVPGAGIRQLFVEDPNGVKVEINVKEPS